MADNHKLKEIIVEGYKSIKKQIIPIGSMNVLIGQNGAGKSNFISLFEFLKDIIEARLQFVVQKAGGAEQQSGIKDLAKDPEGYHNRSEWIWKLGVKPLNVNTLIDGWKEQVSNPINWIAGASALAASYKGLLRGTLSNIQAREW